MFGNYTSNANENTPEDLKHDLRLRMRSIDNILSDYAPMNKELASYLHQTYKQLGIE